MNFQMKLSYKMHKHMKKMYGRNLAFEIAIGRKLIKMMRKG